ncbi:hypothetical protein GCM10007962_12540 [Yeosuana aromativorans]|uniref:Uncharacterized protein n=1 Tax=Yeosuana aromativorans TaxID=288019 RepID=A0A8J3BJZ9_9FLAO|nr:hypothetical protein [Yeosuana aromativorans]GGK19891.1 hypothetical protein GCM10007962_12540 [Yeosuana aromativorans]
MKKRRIEHIEKTGFKVPETYFKDFEDTLLSELNLKDKVSATGFQVPEDYFESLDESIYSRASKNKQGKVIDLVSFKRTAYTVAVAASLVLMFSVFFNKKEPLTLDSIETASIENYILNEDLETTDIASLFSNVDASNLNDMDVNLNSDSLEDYLLENLDVDDLISN